MSEIKEDIFQASCKIIMSQIHVHYVDPIACLLRTTSANRWIPKGLVKFSFSERTVHIILSVNLKRWLCLLVYFVLFLNLGTRYG